MVEIRLLGPADAALFEHVAEGVFDEPIQHELAREFLSDPRHHIAVALDAGAIVGFASGVHYVHPDKPAELFVNEVGVAPTHQRQGLGGMVLRALLERGRELGCSQAWLGTEADNSAARALYSSAGGRQAESPFVLYEFPLAESD